LRLAGRNAIITGSSTGLGASIAEHFIQEGASVLLCAREEGPLMQTVQRLSSNLAPHQRVLGEVADVSNRSDVDSLVSSAIEAFSEVQILVNNAGVYGPFGRLEDIDLDDWVSAIEINLLGTVYTCRALLPHLVGQGYGKIINLSGGGATSPLPRISAYAASKAAVVRFTESLAREVGDGIDVNAIAPGALATRLLDQVVEAGPEAVGKEVHERMTQIQAEGGTPLEKGSALAVYLASAESDGITGRLISAVWDPWPTLHRHRSALDDSDVYTLRRIVPSDRDLDFSA
jgi:3-oxoacyl-[acyl-carrier protein] reductase